MLIRSLHQSIPSMQFTGKRSWPMIRSMSHPLPVSGCALARLVAWCARPGWAHTDFSAIIDKRETTP